MLECCKNPFRRREYDKEDILLETKDLHKLYDNGSGNVSQTFNKCNIGIVSTGKWIGEETGMLKGQIPHFYSAICLTDVKVFEIHFEDFMTKFPNEIKRHLEMQVYPKLYEFRDKLEK